MLGSLDLVWDGNRISLSTEMEFIRVGRLTVERKCEQKHLVHWGLGLTFLSRERQRDCRWSVDSATEAGGYFLRSLCLRLFAGSIMSLLDMGRS